MSNFKSTYLYDVGGRKSVRWIQKRIKTKVNNIDKRLIKILDIGCGTCQLTKIVAENFDCEILAIDIDEKSINMAKKSVKNKNITFKLLDIEKECIEEKFDIILMTQVIDHLKNPLSVLSKISKMYLEQDGILIIGVSNGKGLYERSKKRHKFDMSYLKNKHGRNLREMPYTCNTDSPHLWEYDKDMLVEMLNKSGLKIRMFKKIAFLLPVFPLNRIYFSAPIFISTILDFIDGVVANCMPIPMVSNWYIECKKR